MPETPTGFDLVPTTGAFFAIPATAIDAINAAILQAHHNPFRRTMSTEIYEAISVQRAT